MWSANPQRNEGGLKAAYRILIFLVIAGLVILRIKLYSSKLSDISLDTIDLGSHQKYVRKNTRIAMNFTAPYLDRSNHASLSPDSPFTAGFHEGRLLRYVGVKDSINNYWSNYLGEWGGGDIWQYDQWDCGSVMGKL